MKNYGIHPSSLGRRMVSEERNFGANSLCCSENADYQLTASEKVQLSLHAF